MLIVIFGSYHNLLIASYKQGNKIIKAITLSETYYIIANIILAIHWTVLYNLLS